MLCGQEWYNQHKNDYTEAEIASLIIEISVDKRKLPKITLGERKGKVAEIIKLQRK